MSIVNYFKTYFKYYFPLFLLLTVIFIWLPIFGYGRHKDLKISFLNVGQGDAIFIDGPKVCFVCDNYQILIDAGKKSSALVPLAKILPFYDRSIDLIILSHPQYDHIAGFVEILKRYKVENILMTGVNYNLAEYEEIKRLAKEKKINVVYAKTGQYLKLGDNVFLEIFYPFENLKNKTIGNINNTSIIAKIIHNENTFLFTGDLEEKGEETLLKNGFNLKSRVLKVGHHGSKTSSSEKFLAAVSPFAAIIQSGKKNPYGHPHQIVLDRLKKIKAQVFRNDLNGLITISSDGENLDIKTEY